MASTAPSSHVPLRDFFLPAVVGWVERVASRSLACGAPLRARLGGALIDGRVPSRFLAVCGV